MSFFNRVSGLGQCIENNQGNSEQFNQSDSVTLFNEVMQRKNGQEESPLLTENRKRKFEESIQSTESPFSKLKKIKEKETFLDSLAENSPCLEKTVDSHNRFYGNIFKDSESPLEDSIMIESCIDPAEKAITECMNNLSCELKKNKSFLLNYFSYIIQVYEDERYIITFMSNLKFNFNNDQKFILDIIDTIASYENSEKQLVTFINCLNDDLKEDKRFMLKMVETIAAFDNSEKNLAIFMNSLSDEIKSNSEFISNISTILFSSINESGNIGIFMSTLSDELKQDSEFLHNLITNALELVEGLELNFSVFMSNLIKSLKKDEDLFSNMVQMVYGQIGIIEDNREGYERLFLMALESGYHKFCFAEEGSESENKFRDEIVKENGIVIDAFTGKINNDKNFIVKELRLILGRRKPECETSLDLRLADEIIDLLGEDEECAVEIFQQLSSGMQRTFLSLLKLKNEESTLYGALKVYFILKSTNTGLAKIRDFTVSFK